MTAAIFHKKISEYFDHLLKNNGLSHGYLFSGEDEIGKLYFARQLVGKIAENNGLAPTENFPADVLITEKNPDSKQIKIGQAIEIISFLSIRPQILDKKIVIINDAHCLNIEAQNTLLKTIEEPPPDSLIILTTHLEEKILSTIKSRLNKILFRPIPDQLINNFLTENCDLPARDLKTIADFSAGKIGRALWLKNNLKEFKKNTEELKTFFKSGIKEEFSFIEKISADSQKIKQFLDESLFILRSDLIEKADRGSADVLRNFLKTKNLIENTNVNPRLQLEKLALLLN